MNQVISSVRRFVTSEDGPTAVEYAVLMGLIVVAIVGSSASWPTASAARSAR